MGHCQNSPCNVIESYIVDIGKFDRKMTKFVEVWQLNFND